MDAVGPGVGKLITGEVNHIATPGPIGRPNFLEKGQIIFEQINIIRTYGTTRFMNSAPIQYVWMPWDRVLAS